MPRTIGWLLTIADDERTVSGPRRVIVVAIVAKWHLGDRGSKFGKKDLRTKLEEDVVTGERSKMTGVKQ